MFDDNDNHQALPKIPPPRPKRGPVLTPEAPVRPLGGNPVRPAAPVVPSVVHIPKSKELERLEAGTSMPQANKAAPEARAAQGPGFAKVPDNVVCDLCRVWYRAELEEKFRAGSDPRILSSTYGVPVNLIRQHMTHLEASAKLESTVESISGELNLWRSRVHGLYATAEAMLDVLRNGLVKEIDTDGNIILNSPTFRDIKPTMDIVLKTISAGQSLAETYAKLHQLYKEEDRSGPMFQINYVNINRGEKPVVIDHIDREEGASEGAAVRYIAGDKILETTELPKPQDLAALTQMYLETGTISGPQYTESTGPTDFTRPAFLDDPNGVLPRESEEE